MKSKSTNNGHRTKGAKRTVAPALRKRAQAIINSDAYDEDTRASIRFQLRTGYEGLADMVKRAEDGETICDTVMVGAEQRNAARRVIALFETSGVPDFLTDAMMAALSQASAIETIPLWKSQGEVEAFDAVAVAKLFSLTSMLSLKPKEGVAADKQRVIEATAEILNNPQTPNDLFQGVAEFVTDSLNRKGEEMHHTAPMLAIILDSYPEDELMGAVIAARQEGL